MNWNGRRILKAYKARAWDRDLKAKEVVVHHYNGAQTSSANVTYLTPWGWS